MSDFFGQVTGDQDPLKKLASYIPGFSGYIERQNRRAADKLLRDTVARRFEELYKRLSALQTELISQGGIEYIDEMEKAALLMRTFTDKNPQRHLRLFGPVRCGQNQRGRTGPVVCFRQRLL